MLKMSTIYSGPDGAGLFPDKVMRGSFFGSPSCFSNSSSLSWSIPVSLKRIFDGRKSNRIY